MSDLEWGSSRPLFISQDRIRANRNSEKNLANNTSNLFVCFYSAKSYRIILYLSSNITLLVTLDKQAPPTQSRDSKRFQGRK